MRVVSTSYIAAVIMFIAEADSIEIHLGTGGIRTNGGWGVISSNKQESRHINI